MLFSHIFHSKLSAESRANCASVSSIFGPKKNLFKYFFSSQDLPKLSAYASVTVQVKTTGSSHGEMESVSNRNEEALLGKPQAKLECNSQLGNLLVCISFLPFAAQDFT